MKTFRIIPYLFLSLSITFLANVNCSAAEEEDTPLSEQMDQIGRAWRMVKRGARDASKNAQTLSYVNTMQKAVKDSMHYKPARLADIPESEKEKFLANYNRNIKEFATKLDKLEQLLKAGDNEGASALVKQIDDHRSESHEAFKRPD